MKQHTTTPEKHVEDHPQIRSLAFGITRERIIILIGFAVLIGYVYVVTQHAGEITWLPWVLVGFLVHLAVFNIGLTVTDEQVIIRCCGVRVKRVDLEQIQRVVKVKEGSGIERWSFGLHYLGGGWAYHVGAPNLAFQLKNKKIFLVTVEEPEAVMENIKSKQPAVELGTRDNSAQAMIMGMSFARR